MCAVCGEATVRRAYCSDRCKSTAKKRRQVARWRADPTRVCAVEGCGGLRECGQLCAAHYKRARKGDFGSTLREFVRDRDPICTVAGCDRPHLARGFCRPHWKADAAVRGIPWAVEYMAPGSDRKRAEFYGVAYEPVRRDAIFERDGYVCHLCSLPVDRGAVFPDPGSATIDHIVPISLGGPHVEANLACAHHGCNAAKGNRVIA